MDSFGLKTRIKKNVDIVTFLISVIDILVYKSFIYISMAEIWISINYQVFQSRFYKLKLFIEHVSWSGKQI